MALLMLLPLGTTSAADGPTRATPAGRGYPRAFPSYDSVVAYAEGVASDQASLDAQLVSVRAESDAAKAAYWTLLPTARGGALYDTDSPGATGVIVSQLLIQIRSLDGEAAQLEAAGAFTHPATPWRMPIDGEVTQPFGPTDVWVEPTETYHGVSYAHFHEGVDIAGVWAASVYAPERGRVIYVGMMSDGAEIVVLAHDDGLVSMYAHLDAYGSPPTVAAGDEVAAGQRIGTVGLTGITTGEHLHWAVWRDGTLIDPLSLVGH